VRLMLHRITKRDGSRDVKKELRKIIYSIRHEGVVFS
jgi:hypothetical protein